LILSKGKPKLSLIRVHTENTSESIPLDQVKTELNKIVNPRRNSLQNIWILVVTLVLFLSLGLFQTSFSGITTVIVVLFIHEAGHFIGMKIFGYRDVQMFFIPFFGAAVSGVQRNPSSVQKAIVYLLGPIPGIVLGITSAILFFKTKDEACATAASSFLFINGFNLLPFHPLDGGRFLDCVLFSRNPKIEIAFKLITGLALAGIAFVLRDFFFGVFAFFTLFSLKATSIAANAARKLRMRTVTSDLSEEQAPEIHLNYLINEVRTKLGVQSNNPKLIAKYVHEVWQRARTKPASISATLGMVAVYVPFVVIGILAPFVFEEGRILSETRAEITQTQKDDGTYASIEVRYFQNQKLFEAPINAAGLYHGVQTEWHRFSTQKSKQGMWKDGFWHGEWKSWDREGQLESLTEYKMGKPTRYAIMKTGGLSEVPEREWPFHIRKNAQTEPQGPAEKQINKPGVVKTEIGQQK
jgi:Zn-dependent protease